MSAILTILERSLRHGEGLLAELDHPLAKEAELAVHLALANVRILTEIEDRNSLSHHAVGDRS